MNVSIVVNEKSIAALGVTVVGILLVKKLPSDAAERVLIRAIDAAKGLLVARFNQ